MLHKSNYWVLKPSAESCRRTLYIFLLIYWTRCLINIVWSIIMHYASDEWLMMTSRVDAFDMAFCLADDHELCGDRLQNMPITDALLWCNDHAALSWTKFCLLCVRFFLIQDGFFFSSMISYLWQESKCGEAIGICTFCYEKWGCTDPLRLTHSHAG